MPEGILHLQVLLASLKFLAARHCQEYQTQSSPTVPHKHLQLNIPEQDVQIPRPRNRCCPYDFDSSLCRVVDDRVLCGYNLNVGKPISKNNRIDLNGGCRLRGGRLECGYEQAPFTNPRRPPAWNEHRNDTHEKDVHDEPVEDKVDESEEIREKLKFLVKLSTKKQRASVTRCVEIRERIVCTHV